MTKRMSLSECHDPLYANLECGGDIGVRRNFNPNKTKEKERRLERFAFLKTPEKKLQGGEWVGKE